MGVVMVVFWWRLCGVATSINTRFLDRQCKKAYKAHFGAIKELDCFKKLNIEILEHEEGRWIEIHLSEIVGDDDKEDLEDSEELADGVLIEQK